MLTIDEFHETVLTGHYASPTDHLPVRPLKKGLRSWWRFYASGLGRVVAKGIRVIWKGKVTLKLFSELAYDMTRAVEATGATVAFDGFDALRQLKGKPFVVVANHMSLLETGLLHAVSREYIDFSFVVKESLMRVPYFGDILRALDAIPVSRSNPREDLKTMLREGKRILKSGRSLIVFPQSTRSEVLDPEKFNSIGVKLAKSADVPVLPLALKTDFLANGKLLRDMGPVRPERRVCFEFAPMLEITGNGQEEQARIVDFISSRLDEWRREESGEAQR